MALEVRLGELRAQVLSDMQKYMSALNTQKILAFSRILEGCEALASELEKLGYRLQDLEEAYSIERDGEGLSAENRAVEGLERRAQVLFQTSKRKVNSPTADGDSLRSESLKKAQESRDELVRLVAERHGVSLRPVSKTVYETNNGEAVGIAFATERSPDKWFLGLPEREYRAIILICEKEGRGNLSFVLPRSFCRTYSNRLSTSGNQYKFNVNLRGGRYEFMIPGCDSVSISQYLDRFEGLVSPGAAE